MSHLLKAAGLRKDLQNSTERLKIVGFTTCPACKAFTLRPGDTELDGFGFPPRQVEPDHCINPDCQWMEGDPVPAPDGESLYNPAVTREIPVESGIVQEFRKSVAVAIRAIEAIAGIGRSTR